MTNTTTNEEFDYYDISGGGELSVEERLFEAIEFAKERDDYIYRVWTPNKEYVLWEVRGTKTEWENYPPAPPGVVSISVIHDRHAAFKPWWQRRRPHLTVLVYRMVPWEKVR